MSDVYGLPTKTDDDNIGLDTADENSLFFSRCYKSRKCGICAIGRFKSRFDRAMCCLIFSLIIVLFVGVITPIVMNDIINDQISKSTVIDSTSADSYEAWSTNTVSARVFCANIDLQHNVLLGGRWR